MHVTTPIRHPLRVSRKRRFALYGVAGGLWLSGVLWLVFHYFLARKTSFGTAQHPLEHWWLSLHGLFAFAALWMFGLMWGVHIVGGWESSRRRVTGSVLFAALALLVASGYLIYYPPSEDALPVIALLHWGIGLAAILPFIGHRFLRGAARRHHPMRPPASR